MKQFNTGICLFSMVVLCSLCNNQSISHRPFQAATIGQMEIEQENHLQDLEFQADSLFNITVQMLDDARMFKPLKVDTVNVHPNL
jgi:hypothetical protein